MGRSFLVHSFVHHRRRGHSSKVFLREFEDHRRLEEAQRAAATNRKWMCQVVVAAPENARPRNRRRCHHRTGKWRAQWIMIVSLDTYPWNNYWVEIRARLVSFCVPSMVGCVRFRGFRFGLFFSSAWSNVLFITQSKYGRMEPRVKKESTGKKPNMKLFWILIGWRFLNI